MFLRPAALFLSLAIVSGCETTTVEGAPDPSDTAVARTCIGSVAASLKLDRKALVVTKVDSLPEGDQVTVKTGEDTAVHCFTDLSGKVIAIRHVTPVLTV